MKLHRTRILFHLSFILLDDLFFFGGVVRVISSGQPSLGALVSLGQNFQDQVVPDQKVANIITGDKLQEIFAYFRKFGAIERSARI